MTFEGTSRAARYAVIPLGLSLLVAMSAEAAPCKRWRFDRDTVFLQSDGARVKCIFKTRSDFAFAGNCIHKTAGGEADVHIQGARFRMFIKWTTGPIGEYTGTLAGVSPDNLTGRVLDGRTYDQTNPKNWAKFTVDGLSCLRL